MNSGETPGRAQIRLTAMDLLARREHSRQELSRKLRARYGDHEEIAPVLDQLENEALLSDERFAEAFVRSRIVKGQGSLRIWLELEQRGVDGALARQALDTADVDWYALARKTCQQKFGRRPVSDFREKSRRMRFLHYRGFSSDEIKSALE